MTDFGVCIGFLYRQLQPLLAGDEHDVRPPRLMHAVMLNIAGAM
jgi:hypothetical protein